MSEMNHPPIPPNCTHFLRHHPEPGAAWSFVVHGTNTGKVILQIGINHVDDYHDDWRPVIAAVAEVAWRVECERLWREDCQYDPDRGYMRTSGVAQAEDNAQAWREWGQQEDP